PASGNQHRRTEAPRSAGLWRVWRFCGRGPSIRSRTKQTMRSGKAAQVVPKPATNSTSVTWHSSVTGAAEGVVACHARGAAYLGDCSLDTGLVLLAGEVSYFQCLGPEAARIALEFRPSLPDRRLCPGFVRERAFWK